MPSYRLEPDDIANFDQFVPDFITITSDITDPRIKGKLTHSLSTILFVCVSASMAGAKSINGFGEFAEDAWPWILSCLGESIGHVPVSHDTIGRLLQKLKPDILEELLAQLAQRKADQKPEDQIEIDGKRMVGTARRDLMNVSLSDGGEQPYTTVSAYGVDSGLVLGCHTSSYPGSEHSCIERTLELIDVRGSLVTMDAGNAYPKFCDLILSGKGDYLLCIKGNNAKSKEWCQQIFDTQVDRPYSEISSHSTARGDRRMIRVAQLNPDRKSGHGTGECDSALQAHWPQAQCVVEVQRERTTRNNQKDSKGEKKVSRHTVYYVCSQYLVASDADRYIRSHWHVENKLHWVLDVYYGEDASRAKSGYIAQNLAAIKRMSNNMLAAVTGKSSRMRYQMKFAIDANWRNKVWGLV